MSLSLEQVAGLAPDSGSLAAAKKLMALAHWENLGHDSAALWGNCRGSATYQVKVDLGNLGYHCSCPSRKFPCKHVLGLMMIYAESPTAVPGGAPPEWMLQWLHRRHERQEKKSQSEAGQPQKPVDAKAQQRRAEQREASVAAGLQRLDVWLKDLVRNGLAGLETRPPAFWEEQARRLVDAQAPGLASRVARLGRIPGSGRDWPQRLLAEIGRMKLLLHAWQRLDAIDPAPASDVRQILGWTLQQAELERDGQRLDDTWIVVGQWVDDEDRVRAQHSWLVGRSTGQAALVLQFSAGGQPFPESIVPGCEQRATLLFYPGAFPQRAKYLQREGTATALRQRPPGAATIDSFLTAVGQQLARQPWLAAFAAVLHDVHLVPHDDTWRVVDRDGRALPLAGREHWKLFAVAGGRACDLAGEWDGYALRPLGIYLDNTFWVA